MPKSLKFVPYENHSGFEPDFRTQIPTLPKRHMEILDKAMSGEAPKDFIQVYEYGRTPGRATLEPGRSTLPNWLKSGTLMKASRNI